MFRCSVTIRGILAASALLGLCFVASGCKTWGVKHWGQWGTSDEDGFSEEDKKFTANLRPPDKNSKSTATTAKGREIDRSFGIGGK